MSLLFWRKTNDTGEYRPDGTAQTKDVPASTEDPIPVEPFHTDEHDFFPVRIVGDPENGNRMPPVTGAARKVFATIPGIGTASPYGDGDAFGTRFILHNVFRAEQPSGWITGARLADLDDEGIQVDVHLFSTAIAGTADNSALAPTDIEIATWLGTISIDTFYNLSANQLGQSSAAPMHIVADGPNLEVQCAIRGAANVAAGAIPLLTLFIVPD